MSAPPSRGKRERKAALSVRKQKKAECPHSVKMGSRSLPNLDDLNFLIVFE
jgi:hypothetical protein